MKGSRGGGPPMKGSGQRRSRVGEASQGKLAGTGGLSRAKACSAFSRDGHPGWAILGLSERG